ncbi:phage tail assembly protein [Brucella sp. NBRC 113783]|uniref:phage tail assembly protein n=1 Tax=Brucella sp. NBRC 113783 TaxID=3075478 RepID=UPI0029C033FB|nr:phage tail assembly protein [Brucella sp. NBRC 113783]MDX4074835.1 phage tail assembly protein [Brucella sp. NBRC 113783]
MAKVTSVTVPLEYPVSYKGGEVRELTFRRMKAKDALVAEGVESEVLAGYLLFAALASVDVELIKELDVEDMEAIGERIAPLMGKSATAKLSPVIAPSLGETS